MRILVGDVLARVEHEDHHIGILDRLQGLDDGELLRGLVDLAAAPQARRVDEGVGPSAALEIDVDAVAGGAGLVECDHPLFAENGVDQRRLADVGASHHRDLRPSRLHLGLRLRGRERLQNQLQQIVHAVAVGRRDRPGLAQPELVKLGRGHLLAAGPRSC